MLTKNLTGSELNRECNGRFKTGVRSSPNTEFKPGTHWRKHQPFREVDYLVEEYVNKGRSSYEIATEHGVTDGAILYWLHKNGIPRRDVSDARKLKHWGASGEANPRFGKCGPESTNYIDGSSAERKVNSFIKVIAKQILERDGYECRRCGATHNRGRRLHTHHIIGWAGHPDTRFDLNNIITVCSDCHHWIHSKENVDSEYILS